jgi:hypothetical protein
MLVDGKKYSADPQTNVFIPCCLSLDWGSESKQYRNGFDGSNEPVIPRSLSTFSLSRTCSFFPAVFLAIVPVNCRRNKRFWWDFLRE